jgi:amino acid permease
LRHTESVGAAVNNESNGNNAIPTAARLAVIKISFLFHFSDFLKTWLQVSIKFYPGI